MTTLVLAHGAGAGQDHPFMQRWRERLGALGPVHAFEYPYKAAGKRMPGRLPGLIDAHLEQVEAARSAHGGPVVLVGKSMGGRVGCHVAHRTDVLGVVCLGYPLRSASGKMRDQVLLELPVPALFVQGTRDRLCPLDLLAEVREKMAGPSALHVVDDGDHSLSVAKRTQKRTGRDQRDFEDAAFAAVRDFVEGL